MYCQSDSSSKEVAQEIAKNRNQIDVKYGPYGSKLQETSSMVLEDGYTIKEVVIRHGWILDSIGLVMAKSNRDTITKVFNHGMGHNESKIVLKPDEHITRISGTYGNFDILPNKDIVIATLKIHTNLCPSGYGPYGLGQGVKNVVEFTSPPQINGHVVGLFGRHNQYFESLGVYVKEEHCPCS